jgi:hypothetical protein
MKSRIAWTPGLDSQIRDLRREGVTWDRIADSLGLGRNTVLERGRRIGARRPPGRQAVAAAEEPRDRLPRQAGHPDTWGLITAGTVLEGEPYPYPVFL